MGTILTAVLYGPLWGTVPPILYGLIAGISGDIFAFYYMPAGIILGLATGLVSKHMKLKGYRLVLAAILITIPGTVVSSLITAYLFGVITSSGSAILVQLLHLAGVNLTVSVFLVQILTDFLDRLISLAAVLYLIRFIPADL